VTWLKEKWKILIGIMTALAGALLVLLRFKSTNREHKTNFENSKEAHEAELKILRDSQNSLETGLEKIKEDSAQKTKDIEDESDKKAADLAKEKKEFIDDAKKSDDLARELADAIGADFVNKTER
jgi:translation initiation factor 2B subunit (eIF-2B alpha/beta/delta family)